MSDKADLTRRRVLETVGAGVGTAGMATAASGRGGGERIIGLEAGADASIATDRAVEVTRQLDFGEVGSAVVGTFETREVSALENHSDIRYVEENGRMFALDAAVERNDELTTQGETVPYGIELTDADEAVAEGATGAGTTISVVDTGIDPNHEALAGNVVDGFAPNECSSFFGDCSEPWDDDNDHGTHVAGTAAAQLNNTGVYGVAPEADLLAVKALGGGGGGSFADIAEGIEWSVTNGADVINLSLGGAQSDAVDDAIAFAVQNNVVVVAAAGNDGPCSNCVSPPADNPDAVAVSATDEFDNIASFSSTGPEIEIAAPGAGVLSTVPGDDYEEFSGTSMACPHVAGAVAAVLSAGASPGEVVDDLKSGAEDIGLDENEQGAGRLNVLNAIDEDGGDDPGDPGDEDVEVATDPATDVGETTATLNGTLTTVEGTDTATVFFEYGPVGAGFPESTGSGEFGEGTSFSADLSGLSEGTSYEFRAVASTGDADDEGGIETFETDDMDGGCFVTTATANETETLDSLRRFRDESMATTPVGRGLVGLYYRVSPPIARTMARHPDSTEAAATRGLVDRCADLSDRQAETDSRLGSAGLAVALTVLYVVGLLVGVLGHASLRTRELLD